MKRLNRVMLGALVLVSFTAALVGSASAEVRQGAFTDPTGDASPASRDIVSVTSSYDQGGSWSVSMTFAGAVDTDSGAYLTVRLRNNTDPATPCGGNSSASATFLSSLGGSSKPFFSTQAPGPNNWEGNRFYSADKRTVTFSKSDTRLANYDYKCVTVEETAGSPAVIDQLDTPLYFNGFGPPAPPSTAPPTSGTDAEAKKKAAAKRAAAKKKALKKCKKIKNRKKRNKCVKKAKKKYA